MIHHIVSIIILIMPFVIVKGLQQKCFWKENQQTKNESSAM